MESSDRILIVDDDPEIRRLLADYLTKHGFTAHAARDGREMAQLLDRHAIDLVVLDLNLPGADGLALAVARDAARLHGGELVLENRPDGGLRGVLALPRRPASTDFSAQRTGAMPHSATPSGRRTAS